MVDLFLPSRLRALSKNDCLCENDDAILQLACKMRASTFSCGLLCIISDCAMDAVLAILSIVRAGTID